MKIVDAASACMELLNDSMSGDMDRAAKAMRRVETMDPKDVMIGFVSLMGAMTINLQETQGEKFIQDLMNKTRKTIIQSSRTADRILKTEARK